MDVGQPDGVREANRGDCRVAALLVAGPAHAGEVIVVDGEHAKRVEDPAVPTRAEIALGCRGGARAARVAGRAPSTRERPPRGLRRAADPSSAARASQLRDQALAPTYVRSLRTLAALRGARATQLRYVITSVEALALRRDSTPRECQPRSSSSSATASTGAPALSRGRRPGELPRQQILFQYFPGEGLQIHPLSTFKKANALHGFCERGEAGCDEPALRRLLDEMTDLAVNRGRGFIAWEYLFHFGGGTPPG